MQLKYLKKIILVEDKLKTSLHSKPKNVLLKIRFEK